MSWHTPGPWVVLYKKPGPVPDFAIGPDDQSCYPVALVQGQPDAAEGDANAALIAAAPVLLAEAMVLRCLASSPRFQTMTVAAALAELADNGVGHDGGAAVAAARGEK